MFRQLSRWRLTPAPLLAVLFAMAGAALFADGFAIGTLAAATVQPRTTEQEVAEGLTCQCGCGLTVANCNHPNCSFAVPLRGKIDTMIHKGTSRAEIIAFFRAQYGEKILSAPTTQGFNMLAWTIPPFALILGCVIVLFTIARWRGAPAHCAEPGGSPQPPQDSPSDAELRRRVEREVKEQL